MSDCSETVSFLVVDHQEDIAVSMFTIFKCFIGLLRVPANKVTHVSIALKSGPLR